MISFVKLDEGARMAPGDVSAGWAVPPEQIPVRGDLRLIPRPLVPGECARADLLLGVASTDSWFWHAGMLDLKTGVVTKLADPNLVRFSLRHVARRWRADWSGLRDRHRAVALHCHAPSNQLVRFWVIVPPCPCLSHAVRVSETMKSASCSARAGWERCGGHRTRGLDATWRSRRCPRNFRTDVDRLTRFEREAKVLASLNHPHIAAIYGLEAAAGDERSWSSSSSMARRSRIC